MRTLSTSLLWLALISAGLPGVAQQPEPTQEVGFDGGSSVRVCGITVPPYPGIPFTARVNAEVETTLADGTVVRYKFGNTIARDSAGRVHNESTSGVPADSARTVRLTRFSIRDPKAMTIARCYPDKRTCTLDTLTPQNSGCGMAQAKHRGTLQALGKDVIDDLETDIILETKKIPAGKIGNDREIVETRQSWYSPQYKLDLKVIRNDSRAGKQTLTVDNFVAGEPNPSLFVIPSDYKIVDERATAAKPSATAPQHP